MKHIYTIFFTLLVTSLIAQQDGFKYQAVVRDAVGNIVPNQTVSFRIGIILDAIGNAVTYQETHLVTTTPYGVANLNIGQGTVVSGTFSTIDWSRASFVQVALDLAGGSSFVDMGTSELLYTPKALYAARAGKDGCSGFGVCVLDFGAIGDNTTDDTAAFEAALAAAEPAGQRVIIPAGNYRITSTLEIPRGVMLVGEGPGATALGTPFNGSAIRYEGTGDALLFTGDNSGARDLLVYDVNQGFTNANGIHILADGGTAESLRFFNVLIHYFLGGTALKLDAVNGGGIAYGSFYNVRIRNALRGIHIIEDEPSFTNSNTWHHGAISGGGFESCLLVDGGNNNLFYGTVMEPFQSAAGHILVNTGQIKGYEIRIEAQTQPTSIPVVQFAAGTSNSYLSGLFAHGQVLDLGNNFVDFLAQKSTFYADPRHNLYENSNFYGFANNEIPFWDITEEGGSGTTIELLDPELNETDKVLKLTVPAGVTAYLEPDVLFIPEVGDLPRFDQVHFGAYIKTSAANTTFLRSNAPVGVVSSSFHPGDGNWHFTGMTALVNTSTTLDARFSVANTTGAAIEVYISSPTMNFGNRIPDINPKPVTAAGGILTGPLTQGVLEVSTTTGNFLTLPREGNTFIVSGTQTITRINHLGVDRFPRGTVITLLFDNAGSTIVDNAFISLLAGNNVSTVAGGSLTLLSMGDGTWRELQRNL